LENDVNAHSSTTRQRLLIIIGLLLAGGLGYGIARLAAPGPVAAAVPGAASAPADELQIDESALMLMGISVEAASAGDLAAEVQAPGTVLSSTSGQAAVSAQGSGTVRRVLKRLGDPVQAGDTLALIDSRDAAAMASDLSVAEARADQARAAVKREQDLFAQGVTPRQDLEAAAAAAASAEAELQRARSVAGAAHVVGGTLQVRAPIAGRITAAAVTLGAYVDRNIELYRIADPRHVLVEAAIPPLDAVRVGNGSRASIVLASGRSLPATVQSVTPTVNEATRAVTAVLALKESAMNPLPGEFVQVRIEIDSRHGQGVIVPQDAVQTVNGTQVVFVRTGTGFRAQPVRTAAGGGARVQVVSGLKSGDRIAVANAFLLKAELSKGAGDDEE
jgi:membrane fusion protein, heavy metal efflux system